MTEYGTELLRRQLNGTLQWKNSRDGKCARQTCFTSAPVGLLRSVLWKNLLLDRMDLFSLFSQSDFDARCNP